MDSSTITYTVAGLPATVTLLTQQIDKKIAESSKAVIVTLSGDLGAGKTTLVKELAAQYGVTDTVTSPTFVVMRRYEPSAESPIETLVHIDAYRIEQESELAILNIEEIFDTPKTLVCIEWPEQIPWVLTNRSLFKVVLSTVDEETRTVDIQYTAV